jgi:MFS family permease
MDSEAQITEVTPLIDEYSQKNSWDKFKESFHLLHMSPRDLYIAYIMKTTCLVGYCPQSIILPLYFTTELSFSDWEAGILFSAKGVITGFYSIILGTIPDKYGIKFTTVISQIFAAFGLLVAILSSNRWVEVGMLLGPYLLGFSLAMPPIELAIKRFTLPAAHSIAFSILHMFLCLGDFIGGILADVVISVNGINLTSFWE